MGRRGRRVLPGLGRGHQTGIMGGGQMLGRTVGLPGPAGSGLPGRGRRGGGAGPDRTELSLAAGKRRHHTGSWALRLGNLDTRPECAWNGQRCAWADAGAGCGKRVLSRAREMPPFPLPSPSAPGETSLALSPPVVSTTFNASRAARKRGLRLGRAGVLPSSITRLRPLGNMTTRANLLPGRLTSASTAFGPPRPHHTLFRKRLSAGHNMGLPWQLSW